MQRLLLLLTMLGPAWGATYYISPTGNDAAAGTLAAPFQHLSHAASVATSPGDTVIALDGTYDNEGVVAPGFVVTLANSGTAGNPITFRAQNRGGAILDSMNTSTTVTCNGAASYFDLANAAYIVIHGFVIQRACDSGFQSNDAAHDITIQWNEIRNIANHTVTDTFGRDGIFMNATQYNFIFDGNIWHDIGRTGGTALLHYDHGIYAQSTGVTIINNVFYNMNRGWSIQLANGATNWLIANNTFSGGNANGDVGQIMWWDVLTNIAVTNNIFYLPNGSALTQFTPTITGSSFSNNMIFGTTNIMTGPTTGIAIGVNQLGVNPVFVNPTATPPGFQLQSTSPAINAGATLAAVTTDLNGSTRSSPPDMGAYEFIAAASPNSVFISELTGTAQTSRPFTISRVFTQGEISNYPQPFIGGVSPAAWQADVKTRWPSGSVRHAMISFRATLGAGALTTVTFANNSNPCSTGNLLACQSAALTQQAMLDFNAGGGVGSWRARIQGVASGITQSAEARAMIATGNWSYWLRGPVVTQVIVEDKTTALAYDFGWSCTANCTTDYATATWVAAGAAAKSLHPLFVVGFYPGFAGVEVDYILESPWSTRQQDQRYDLTVTRNNPETSAYTQAGLTHWSRGRWHKKFWNGTTPGRVKMDLNLPYLISSRALPQYDLTKVVPPSTISSVLTQWAGTDKNVLMGNYPAGGQNYTGFFVKFMPNTGGRQEVGLFPTWTTRYFYTFHTTSDGNDLHSVMLGNADLIGQAPMHAREGDPSTALKFCALSAACVAQGLQNIPAFGYPRSRDAFPLGPNSTTLVPLSASHNWTLDVSHQASMAYIPYTFTGDYYYLQEMNYWAGFSIQRAPVGTTRWYMGHDDWAYMREQVRGMAWALRNVGHAAVMNPDGTPEKAYFTQKLLNNIAVHEGKLDLRTGYGFTGDNTKWQWGYTEGSNIYDVSTPTTHRANPLNWVAMDATATLDNLDTTAVQYPTSQWQIHFFLISIAHLEELGFPFTALKAAVAGNVINQLQNPAYNPWLIAAYRTPAVMTPGGTGTWFSTWPNTLLGFLPAERTRTSFPIAPNNADGGYDFIARGAAAFLPGISSGGFTGTNAYAWFTGKLNESLMNSNPKWAFLPRSGAPTVPLTLGCPASSATVSSAYASAFGAFGGSGSFTAYAIISGALPSGLSLNSTNGGLTGTPTLAGTFSFTGRVTDSAGATATSPCSITVASVAPPITLSCPTNGALVNTPYSSAFGAAGGSGSFTAYAIIAGSLPPGMTLNAGTGALTGTPTLAATYSFTGRVTDSAAATGTSPSCSITVAPNGAPSCDINQDGRVNNIDVQLSLNNAINGFYVSIGDLDHDGASTVIDTQRTVNAAIGGACLITGPSVSGGTHFDGVLGGLNTASGCTDFAVGGTIAGQWYSPNSYTGTVAVTTSLDISPGTGNTCTVALEHATASGATSCNNATFTAIALGSLAGSDKTLTATANINASGPFCMRLHWTLTGGAARALGGGMTSLTFSGPGPLHYAITGPAFNANRIYLGQVNRDTSTVRPWFVNNTPAIMIKAKSSVALAVAPGAGKIWALSLNVSTTGIASQAQTCQNLTYVNTGTIATMTGTSRVMTSALTNISLPPNGCVQMQIDCTTTGCANPTTGIPSGGLDVGEKADGTSDYVSYGSAGSGAFDANHIFDSAPVNTCPWGLSDINCTPGSGTPTLGQQYWRAGTAGVTSIGGIIQFAGVGTGTGQYNVSIRYSTTVPGTTQGCLNLAYTNTATLATMLPSQKSVLIPWTPVSIPAGRCFALYVTTSGGTPDMNLNEWNWQVSTQ